MDELVDIVDENNAVLYQILKSSAHEKNLLHRTIIAECIDSKGNWTLVSQSGHKQDPDQFVNPVGGHIQAGEAEAEALTRESVEEIGIIPERYKRIGSVIYSRDVLNRHENHFFILYEVYSDHHVVLNEESHHFRSFSVKELRQLLKEKPEMFGAPFHFIAKHFYHTLLF